MLKHALASVTLGLSLATSLAPSLALADPVFASGYRQLIHYHAHSQGKRGLGEELTYDAELSVDPEDPSHAIGIGHYSGVVVFRKANCHNNLPDFELQVPVSGDLKAEAWINASFEEGGPNFVRYTLTTLDWRVKPFFLDPSLYGDNEYTNYYAETPEELEMIAGFGTVISDPWKGVPLTGNPATQHRHTVVSNNDCDGEVSSDIDESVSIVAEDRVLTAIPDVSTSKFRGEKVVLDGTLSTPADEIRQYHWKLEPGADCPAGLPTREFDGKRVEVQLLCSAKATLTVSTDGGVDPSLVPPVVGARASLAPARGKTRDSKTVNVPLQPRPWKTKFKHLSGFGKLSSAAPLVYLDPNGNFLGRNVCQYEGMSGEQHSGHFVHSGPVDGPSDLLKAVHLSQVNDPNSPSNGKWFVDSKQFEVARAALIHPSLFNYSELEIENRRRCQNEKVSPCGFTVLMDSTRAHETVHSMLMQEKLNELRQAKKDPAQKIESMQDDNHDELLGETLVEISNLETALAEATDEAHVHARMRQVEGGRFATSGFIWLPTSTSSKPDWAKLSIQSFADVGD